MAISSIGNRGTGVAGATASTTVTITPTATIAVDRILLVSVVSPTATHSSVTDTGGNTYEKVGESSGNSQTTSIWRSKITTQLTTSSTITCTFGSSIADKCAGAWEFSVTAGNTLVLDQETENTAASTSGFGSLTNGSLGSAARLYFRAMGKNANSTTALTPSTNFTNTTWAIRSRNNTAARILRAEFRLNTSTGETSNPTFAVTGAYATTFVALSEAVPPVTGTSATTLGAATSSASGSADPIGSSAATLAAATSAGVGSTPMGTLAIDAHADRLTTTAVPTTPTSFSIGFWVKRKSGHGDPGMFVTVDGSGYTFSIGTDANLLTLWNVGGGYTKPLQISGAMTQDKWYFVGFKATSSTTGVLYRFDEAGNMATASGSLGFTLSTLTKTTICGDDVGSFFPTVDMGRVRVHAAQLSDAEFDAERLSPGAVVRTSNLDAVWNLESDANKLVDSSGNSRNLTAAGAGPWAAGSAEPVPVQPVTGTGAPQLVAATGAGTGIYGTVTVEGTGSPTLGAATMAATGNQPVAGTATPTLGAATSFFTADNADTPLDFKTKFMPRISLGKPIYGTGADIADFLDDAYGYSDEAWTIGDGSWAALNLGAGPKKILVAFSCDNASGGSWSHNSFADYRVQVSNNSTNGSDGTWTTRATITSNPAVSREHLIDFDGYSWVKIIIDSVPAETSLDEFDVWDATEGVDDTFAFLGDSITDGMTRRFEYVGGGQQPSFQNNVKTNQTGHYPLQVNVGATGQGAAYWAANISTVLALYPDLKYWCVNIGMNDGASMPSQLSTWITDMTTVINAITSAGRVPILARTTYTGAAGYGGGDYITSNLRYLNDNGVNYLCTTLGVRRGPDLFQLFYANRTAYAVTTDPHPNETGYKAMSKAWADNLGINPDLRYGHTKLENGSPALTLGAATASGTGSYSSAVSGTIAVTLGAATSSASGTHSIAGTSAVSLGAATSSASGAHGVAGSEASTLGAATSSGAGTHSIAGTSATTLSAATSSASGAHGVAGTSATSLGAATSSASATHSIAGTSATTLGAATSTASGTHTAPSVTGTAAPSLADATSSATATHPRYGTSAATLGNATSSATAGHGVAGTSSATLGAATSSGTATHPRYGTSAATLGAATSSAAGTHSITGTSATNLGASTSSASGAVGAAGTSAATLAAATSTATGTHSITGTMAATLGVATQSASGTHTTSTVSGNVTVTLGDATGSASGTVTRTGTAASTLGEATSSGSGAYIAPVTGTVSSTLGGVQSVASAGHGVAGSASSTLSAGVATAAAGHGVAGSGSATLNAVLGTAVGSHLFGTVSAVLGAATPSVLGGVGNAGSVSATVGNDTLVASGFVVPPTITGTSAILLSAALSTSYGLGDVGLVDPFTLRGWSFGIVTMEYEVTQAGYTAELPPESRIKVECMLDPQE